MCIIKSSPDWARNSRRRTKMLDFFLICFVMNGFNVPIIINIQSRMHTHSVSDGLKSQFKGMLGNNYFNDLFCSCPLVSFRSC